MTETFLSFYLRSNQILVHVASLRAIGSPHRICFLISPDGKSLLLIPYGKRDLKSHNIPYDVYRGSGGFRVNSKALCRILAGMHSWDTSCSYRVPGTIHRDRQLITFDLEAAGMINPQTLQP